VRIGEPVTPKMEVDLSPLASGAYLQHSVMLSPSPLILDQSYINTKNQVIKAERRVLKELGFCVHVKHPHKIIVMYLQVLECERNQTLVQTAWNYMNDCLRTNVFVRFEAETIACACIYLAARALQPNYDFLDKEVEKRKVALQEAKLKAKGLNPDGTPALSTMGGFSPGSKPSSPREVKAEEKSPVPTKIKREPEEKQTLKTCEKKTKEVEVEADQGHEQNQDPALQEDTITIDGVDRSGTYSSRSRSRSRSHSESPRRHHNHSSPHLKLKHRGDDLRGSNRHAHKRKKSHSPTPGKSREHSDPSKKHRHDRGHHRDRRERSRSFERSHKSKHHGSGHSGHGRHRR
ncbi:unnamed protein product, partial [Ranitomeya imitator]